MTPPKDLNEETLSKIERITMKIAKALHVKGPFNMQLIAKDNELKVIECNVRVSRQDEGLFQDLLGLNLYIQWMRDFICS